MGKRLFVGNLAYIVSDEMLADTFLACGKVERANIATDRETGRSRGFGFVEMSSESEARAALERFNGEEYEGRKLFVDIAKPSEAHARRRRGG